MATPNTALAVDSTSACPTRSTSRAWKIAAPALATMYAAETAPARPYEPVAAETSRTMPSPTMEIGRRATRPAALKRRVPGSASTRR
jgi:hypothetical protein